MKLKRILLLLVLVSLLMLLPAIPVNAQPPAFIQNNQIRLTLGGGWNAQGPWTIVGMAPVKALWRDIVWFGEYEYLSTSGPPPAGGPWPGLLVPLWGPAVPRTLVGFGATWYRFTIGPVLVGAVWVTVDKTVSLPAAGTWGWARIQYQILPLSTVPQLWLYYSIDYCDGPVTGSPLDNVWSWTYGGPLGFEPLSRQVPPVPMPTPPGGGLIVNTKATGLGVLGSWQFVGGSSFPVTRYCGYWFNGLYDTWPNGANIIQRDDGVAFAVDLGTVTAAGTVCDQLFLGCIPGDPPQSQSPEEPSLPSTPLTAIFDIEVPPALQPQIIEGNHTVKKTFPIAGQMLTFDASASFDLNTSHAITQYEWDFGDGTLPFNTTEPITTHVYAPMSNYNATASLTLYNNVSETAHAEHTFEVAPTPVGGVWVPVDKFGLLAPYLGIVSTILVATAATAIYVKRRKKKQ